MKAYLGSLKLKSDFIKQIKWHQDQDAIVQGSYGKQNGTYQSIHDNYAS